MNSKKKNKNNNKNTKKNKKKINKKIIKGVAVTGGVIALSTGFLTSDSFKAKDIDYKKFEKLIETHQIEEIQINNKKETLIIKDKNNNTFKIINPGYETFRQECLQQGIKFTEKTSLSATSMISIGISSALLLSITKQMNLGTKSKKIKDSDIPNDTLDELVGVDEVKDSLKLALKYLENPEEFDKYGAKMPTGMVFYGPPGTGKTKLARAVAGEANVPFYYLSGSEFVELYAGMGARKVRALFEDARKNAPCIIFIDEIDAIGKKRSSNGNNNDNEREQTLNELLTQLDGFENNKGILTICATNRLDALDEALIRPGRFSEKIMITVPRNKEERLKILELYSSNKKVSKSVLEYMATVSTGFSGAELENFMNNCALTQIKKNKDYIDLEVAEDALFKILTNGTKITSNEKRQEENEIIAWHEAGHALATKLYNEDFIQVTITGSSSGIGGFSLQNTKDNLFPKLSELKKHVKIFYAGRIAESFLLGDDITTGAHDDIKKASEIIKDMILCYGMDKNQTMLNLDVIKDEKYFKEEAKIISDELYKEVFNDLESNKHILEDIAKTLLIKETLYNDDLEDILNKHYHNEKDTNDIEFAVS